MQWCSEARPPQAGLLLQRPQRSAALRAGGACGPTTMLHAQACQVVDECLMRSLDLFFHKHSAVVIACGIYAAAKVSKLPLSFKTIMAHMVQQAPPGSSISEATFKAVELGVTGLEGAWEDGAPAYASILYLPACQAIQWVRGGL